MHQFISDFKKQQKIAVAIHNELVLQNNFSIKSITIILELLSLFHRPNKLCYL